MATKEERYDPGFNYDSEPEELNNRSEKNGSSPPSSPVDNVYLTGEFIYNDVWSGWRCGGPMADTDPEKKKEKKDKESEEKEGSAAQAKGSEASTTKPDTKEEKEKKDKEAEEKEGSAAQPDTKEEKKRCIYCGCLLEGRPWSGSGFKCHTGRPGVVTDHDQFCEKCARGNPDRLRKADQERGEMTCPKDKKGRKAASASDSEPYQV